MMLRHSILASALLFTGMATARSQQQQPADAPIVQPGAPGQGSRTLTPATATGPTHKPSEADIQFMQGMIMHHGQAVEMTALLRTRSHNKEVQAMGERISISQTDEMRFMKQWLGDHGEPLSPAAQGHMDDMAGMDMAGMDHSRMEPMGMGAMPAMPGMLTAKQMAALEKASGPEFDHLFLTGMIQHHTGALTMVKTLFDTPGSGQDPQLFDFANDVDNTQLAEIDFMKGMLKKEKQ